MSHIAEWDLHHKPRLWVSPNQQLEDYLFQNKILCKCSFHLPQYIHQIVQDIDLTFVNKKNEDIRKHEGCMLCLPLDNILGLLYRIMHRLTKKLVDFNDYFVENWLNASTLHNHTSNLWYCHQTKQSTERITSLRDGTINFKLVKRSHPSLEYWLKNKNNNSKKWPSNLMNRVAFAGKTILSNYMRK